MTSPVDIEKLRALLEKATPGEWSSLWGHSEKYDNGEDYVVVTDQPTDGFGISRCVVGLIWMDGLYSACREGDAALIAASRNVLPELLDEVERLRLETAELAVELESTALVGFSQRSRAKDAELAVERLRREVYALRAFGNKDCTHMADKALRGEYDLPDDPALGCDRKEGGADAG